MVSSVCTRIELMKAHIKCICHMCTGQPGFKGEHYSCCLQHSQAGWWARLQNMPYTVVRWTNISTQESQLFKLLSVKNVRSMLKYHTLKTLRRPGSTDLLSLNLNSNMPVIWKHQEICLFFTSCHNSKFYHCWWINILCFLIKKSMCTQHTYRHSHTQIWWVKTFIFHWICCLLCFSHVLF